MIDILLGLLIVGVFTSVWLQFRGPAKKDSETHKIKELAESIEKLKHDLKVSNQDVNDLELNFAKLHEFVQRGLNTMATRNSRAKKIAEEMNLKMLEDQGEDQQPQQLRRAGGFFGTQKG